MTTQVLVGLILATLFSASAALRVLLARPAGRDDLGMGRVALAALAVSGATVLEVLVLMWAVRLGPFGMIHLAWLTLTVVVPLCGLSVLVTRLRKTRRVSTPATVVAGLSLFILPVAAWALWVGPYDLRVERTDVAVASERMGTQPIVLGVLADLQTTRVGPHEEAAVAALMAGEPDVILVPGDIFQGHSEDFDEVLPDFQRLLSTLSAPGGVWVVPGNTDYQDGLPRLLEGTGARLLRDEQVSIRVGDRRLTIFGADEPHSRGWGARVIPGLSAFESAAGDDDIRILLAHRPRLVSELAHDSRVDLVVAGHTHGGQVAIPFLGPPLVLSPLPRRIAAGGLHDLDGRTLYISRGVGLERHQAPRIRFLVPPEVSLLTLHSPPVR